MQKPNDLRFTTRRRWLNPNDRGFTLIELLIVVAIILIIAAIAIPSILRSKMAANESSAVENLRTISTAAVVYNSTYENGYPPSLAALGGISTAAATCDASILIEENLSTAPNQKSGYQFAYIGENGAFSPQPPNCGSPGYNGYLSTATPISVGQTGQRSFCSDTPGVIHFDITGATTNSIAVCDALPGLQ